MTSLKRNPWLGLCTLGAATLLAPAAFAQQECGGTTCDAGYECLTYDAPCPQIACAEGEDCDLSCETEVSYCERAECGSDADCGDYMICATQQRWECPAVDAKCDADGNCPDVESVECTPTDYQVCTPPWELPCESASDCGEGFTCEAIEECACSGAEPAPADAPAKDEGAQVDGGAAPDEAAERVALADNCECKPGDVSYCQIVETACEADADCPEHWTCVDNPNGVCWADSEGNSGCETPDPAKLCNPPGYYTIAVRGGAADSGIAESGIAEPGVATSSDGKDLAGDPEATPVPAATEEESESADDGEASVTSIDEDDASNASDKDDDEVAITREDEDSAPGGKSEDDGASDGKSSSVEEDGGEASSSGGGCSVSARKGSGDAWSLLLIALGAALHRVRRRGA